MSTRARRVIVGIGILFSLALVALCQRPPLQPEALQLGPPTLSFELQSEYQQRLAEIDAKQLDGKSRWGEVKDLVSRLVGERATADDRRALVAMVVANRDRFVRDHGDSLFAAIPVHLIGPLSEDGAREQLVKLLASGCVRGGISGPLTGYLHALRLQGMLEDGLGVLFDAYDAADRRGKASIAETLRHDFAYFFGWDGASEKKPSDEAVVTWCREWYAANADLVMPDLDTWMSGSEDTHTAPVLITYRAWLEHRLQRATTPLRTNLWTTDEPSNVDSVFLDEQAAWVREFDERPPTRYSVTIVEPADGRSNSFMSGKIVCDIQIRSTSANTAIIPARFARFWYVDLYFIGEDWTERPLRPWGDRGGAVVIKHFPGQEAAGKRVEAAIMAGALADLGPDAAPLQVKVYPSSAQLAAFVSPNAPKDLAAFSRPGQSLKIVVSEDVTDAQIRERLVQASKLRAAP